MKCCEELGRPDHRAVAPSGRLHRSMYSYVEIASAAGQAPGGIVNIWAVVVECSVPRPTRGTDMVCNLTLVDPSTPDRADTAAGVEMLCFAATAGELPHLRRPGDIIRLHRVKMNRYNDRPQLVGKVGARSGGFAFCLFDAAAPPEGGGGAPGGRPQQLLRPYQISGQHYHFDEREEMLLRTLRTYMATMNRAQMTGSTAYLRRLREVRPLAFFDCACRVVALDDSDPALRLLHVWDASDVLPFPVSYDTREQETSTEAQRMHQHLRPFALPLEHMPDRSRVPLVGTALPLVFPKSGRVEPPAVGSWVKMRNLGARVVGGQLQAYFQRNSRWTPWHDQAGQREIEEEYQQRLAANHTAGWAPDPQHSSAELLSQTRHRRQPLSTVRQVMLDTPAAAPRCYRLLVRLLDYGPRDPADMCHPAAQCGLPGGDQGRWVYTLKLLVEDSTGQLDVILFGPDADAFFVGLPARDMRADAAAAEEVLRCCHRLMGQGCQRDGGPWMEVSIKTYFTDPSRPWQTRQYRMCDTTLTLPPLPDAAAG